MQRMILVPTDQYDHMLEGYDKAMEELSDLREPLQVLKEGDRAVSKD